MPILSTLSGIGDHASAAELRELVITPSDPLGPRDTFKFMASLLAILLVQDSALSMFVHWTIAAFAALDGLFLGAALFLFRHHRQTREHIVVERGSIRIASYTRGRLLDQRRLAVVGSSIMREDDPDQGCLKLALVEGGRTIEIGTHLSPDERESLHGMIFQALTEIGHRPRVETTPRPAIALQRLTRRAVPPRVRPGQYNFNNR
jgi:uncharacterized membrane protein